MNISLLLGKTAGLLAFLIAQKYNIVSIVAYDNKEIYKNYPVFDSIHDQKFIESLSQTRLLLSVHGREIVPKSILDKVAYKANVHPFYEKYKGSAPIDRAIRDNYRNADVTAHIMTEKLDNGEIIVQLHKEVKGIVEQEIYNELYPLYVRVIQGTIEYFDLNDKQIFCCTD